MMSQLHRLLYRSDAALLGSSEETAHQMRSIVERSQARNAEAGLTGALLISAGVFIQALEGPLERLEQTFERICSDLRHRRVRLLQLSAVETRFFDGWSMASVAQTRDLMRLGWSLADLDVGRIDAISAGTLVELMRSMLHSERLRPA